jgi:FkbH-like protein
MTALGAADPTPGTVQALYRQRRALEADTTPDIRIALLSTSTVDLLAAYLDLELRRLGLQPALYLAPFNAITLEVLNPGSGLYASTPDLIFLSAALDDLVPELGSTTARAELETKGRDAVATLISQVRALLERTAATVVLHSLHSPTIGVSPLDWRADGRGSWMRDLNAELLAAFGTERRVHLLDVAHVAALRHEGRYENPKMRYMASMRYSEGLVPAVAAAYARYAVPLKGLTKKCLVLDCDNTLWGGIVGEDGPTGIRLGNTSPGIEYRDFQLAIQALSKRGILLAINSKNNPDDALEVIRSHPWMVLREDAFSALRINWTSKVENLKSIADELNIGLDSLVFMDDNPVECEQVRQMLPQVVTVQMPKDPSRYRETLESLPWFESFAVTAEDLQRLEQYRANHSREALKSTTQSVEDYLGSLNILVGIRPIAAETLARCVQLVNRTNQFNLTTRRYTAEDIERMLASDAWHTFTLSARDKFGDHGLVGLALVERTADAWRIDTLLMSCRVLGQGIEQSLLATIHASAVADGASALEGAFIPTKKNAQVRDLYPRFGFASVGAANDGAETYRLLLPSTLSVPPWITVER